MSLGFQIPREASITRRVSPEGRVMYVRSARVTKPPFRSAWAITDPMIESLKVSAVITRLFIAASAQSCGRPSDLCEHRSSMTAFANNEAFNLAATPTGDPRGAESDPSSATPRISTLTNRTCR